MYLFAYFGIKESTVGFESHFPRALNKDFSSFASGGFTTGDQTFNPLTTNDDYSRHQNSAACYQLVQSLLKIGSALVERVGRGEVDGMRGGGWVSPRG